MENLGQMMEQMQKFQSQMQTMHAELERLEIKGMAGGGLVTVTLNGKGKMTALDMDRSVIKPDEREIMADLLIAAFNDARAKVEQAVAEEIRKLNDEPSLSSPPNLG